MEVIIIDDNSDSTKVDFANFPGKNRPSTTVVLGEGGHGAGAARNIGLQLAKGRWLIFADADDYYSTVFETMLSKYANDNRNDLVFWNAISVDENGATTPLSINLYIDNYMRGKAGALDVLRFQFWAPWNRMVKSKVFRDNDIKFEEIPTGNDCLAMLKSSMYGGKCAVENEIVYYYYKPTCGSQTSRSYNYEAYVKRLIQSFKINAIYKSVGYPYLWPISRLYNNKEWNATEEVRIIKIKNGYSKLQDYKVYIKYIIAKFKRII